MKRSHRRRVSRRCATMIMVALADPRAIRSMIPRSLSSSSALVASSSSSRLHIRSELRLPELNAADPRLEPQVHVALSFRRTHTIARSNPAPAIASWPTSGSTTAPSLWLDSAEQRQVTGKCATRRCCSKRCSSGAPRRPSISAVSSHLLFGMARQSAAADRARHPGLASAAFLSRRDLLRICVDAQRPARARGGSLRL